ncbi:MAG TPA: PRC-barrel domain-containing protein [Gemmatimonadaceae bacterium]|nr:PRC-barrel domain-containing protein [Gemmatimonadaceae bacterium]
MDINVELLLGTKVYDVNGEKVGRIEELRAEQKGKSCYVESYMIGASALVERMSAWTLVRPIKRMLKARHVYSAFEVPWQEMDLSDPKRPRLTIAKKDLRHAR